MNILIRSSILSNYNFADAWFKYLSRSKYIHSIEYKNSSIIKSTSHNDIALHLDPFLDIDVNMLNILYAHNMNIDYFNYIYGMDLYDAFIFPSDAMDNAYMDDKLEESVVIPFAVDSEIYYPTSFDIQYNCKISYTANYIEEYDDIFSKYDISVYNTANLPIKHLKLHCGNVAVTEQRFLYSSTKLHLSFHSELYRQYGIVNEDIYNAAACGAPIVSDIHDFYDYNNLDELLNTTHTKSYDWALSNTYIHRINKLLRWLIEISN